MQNTSKIIDKSKIKYKFDLKGSKVSRYTKFDQNSTMSIINDNFFSVVDNKSSLSKKKSSLSLFNKKLMKDVNFLDINKVKQQHGSGIVRMETDDQTRLKKILAMDSKFLMNHNLMDYSLFLVVE